MAGKPVDGKPAGGQPRLPRRDFGSLALPVEVCPGHPNGATRRHLLAHVAEQRIVKRLRRREMWVERRNGRTPVGAWEGAKIIAHDIWLSLRQQTKRKSACHGGVRRKPRGDLPAAMVSRDFHPPEARANRSPALGGGAGRVTNAGDGGGHRHAHARAAGGHSGGDDSVAAAGDSDDSRAAAGDNAGGDGDGSTAPERPGGQRLTPRQNQPALAQPGRRRRPWRAPLQRLLRISLSYLAPAAARRERARRAQAPSGLWIWLHSTQMQSPGWRSAAPIPGRRRNCEDRFVRTTRPRRVMQRAATGQVSPATGDH